MALSQVDLLTRNCEEFGRLSRGQLLARSLTLRQARKVSPELRRLLSANVVRSLFLTASGVVLLDSLIAIVVACVFWSNGPQKLIAAWLALVLATAVVRWLHIARYFQAMPPPADSPRWARLFAFGALMSGFLWGVGNIVFYVPGNGLLLVVQVFVVTGLSACALAGYSARMTSFYAFVVPMILPFAVCLSLDGAPAHMFTTALLAAWLSIVIFLAHLLNQHIVDRLLLLDRAMLTETMERSRDAAEAASRAKSRLLANVSHELRTPLNAIIGFSEAMSAELFGRHSVSRYREYSQNIKASGSHLLELITDIVDAAKVESGHARLVESVVEVADLLEETKRMLRFGANNAGVVLDVFVPRDLPAVRVDALRFRQVLNNVLSNAVKFSPAGRRVSVIAAAEAGGDLVIDVKDNGIGMKKTDIEKVLLPFDQATRKSPRGDTGSGVGLAIAKVLVEAHGGKLLLESELGIGTTVTIRLPKERFLSPAPGILAAPRASHVNEFAA